MTSEAERREALQRFTEAASVSMAEFGRGMAAFGEALRQIRVDPAQLRASALREYGRRMDEINGQER